MSAFFKTCKKKSNSVNSDKLLQKYFDVYRQNYLDDCLEFLVVNQLEQRVARMLDNFIVSYKTTYSNPQTNEKTLMY